MSFHGSNTNFIFNGRTYSSNNGTQTMMYPVASTLTFKLDGNAQHGNADKVLNKLVLTVGDMKSKSILIPAKQGETEITELENGIQAAVKYTGYGAYSRGGSCPKYTVILTAKERMEIHGEIAVETNYKTVSNSEIWAQDLVGVEPLPYFVSGKGYVSGSKGDQTSAINPETFTFYDRTSHTSKDTYIFVKVKPGFSEELEDISLRVVVDGEDYSGTYISELKPIPQYSSSNGFSNARKDGCQYYFTISKDVKTEGHWTWGGWVEGDDVRI